MSYDFIKHGMDVDMPNVDGVQRPIMKLVYLIILEFANSNNDNQAWPSLATLTRRSCAARSTVQNAIKALAEHGFITTKNRYVQGTKMNTSNIYRVDTEKFNKTDIPLNDVPIPSAGIGVCRDTVTEPLPEPVIEPVIINKSSDEELASRLNNSSKMKLPRFPDFGNYLPEIFLELDEDTQNVIKNMYIDFHNFALTHRNIDHTWNPYFGLELLSVNNERFVWLMDLEQAPSFSEFLKNRYVYRNIKNRSKSVNLNWMLWSNDEDSTGYCQVENVIMEGESYDE
jgi:hypothetical protein